MPSTETRRRDHAGHGRKRQILVRQPRGGLRSDGGKRLPPLGMGHHPRPASDGPRPAPYLSFRHARSEQPLYGVVQLMARRKHGLLRVRPLGMLAAGCPGDALAGFVRARWNAAGTLAPYRPAPSPDPQAEAAWKAHKSLAFWHLRRLRLGCPLAMAWGRPQFPCGTLYRWS